MGGPSITSEHLSDSHIFHPGGANVLFADGHTVFLKETASPVVVASLVSRAGGEVVQDGDY